MMTHLSDLSRPTLVACAMLIGACRDSPTSEIQVRIDGRDGISSVYSIHLSLCIEGAGCDRQDYFGEANTDPILTARRDLSLTIRFFNAESGQGDLFVVGKGRNAANEVGRGRIDLSIAPGRNIAVDLPLEPTDVAVSDDVEGRGGAFFSSTLGGRQVVAAAQGHYFIVWRHDCDGSSPQASPPCHVRAREYSETGEARPRGSFNLDRAPGAHRFDMPAIAMHPDSGEFAAVWKRTAEGEAPPTPVFSVVFNPDGTPNSNNPNERQLSTPNVDASTPDVAALGDGRYAAVWRQRDAATMRSELVGMLISATGTPDETSRITIDGFTGQSSLSSSCPCAQAGEVCLANTPNGENPFISQTNVSCFADRFDPAIASRPGSAGFAVAWRQAGELQLANFPAGATTPTINAVRTEDTGSVGAFDLLGLPYGYVVVWSAARQTDDPRRTIRLRRFSTEGEALSPAMIVNTTTTGDHTLPSIAASAGGGMLVAWSASEAINFDERGNGVRETDGAIRGRAFLANGLPIGDDFPINTTQALKQTGPSIAARSDNSFVVAFANLEPAQADSSAIRARQVYPVFEPRDGKLGSLCAVDGDCRDQLRCVTDPQTSQLRCHLICDGSNPVCPGGTCASPPGVTDGTLACLYPDR